MSNRSWYYAAQGVQQGPVSEAELRALVSGRVVSAETLVWTDGMAGWERAGQIPGLISELGGLAPDPSNDIAGGPAGIAPLSAKLDLWPYFGRGLLLAISEFLVVPTPWAAVYFYRYVAEHIRVPGRPNLSFTGQPLEIWYVFMGLGALIYLNMIDSGILHLAIFVAQGFLGWMITRWGISRLASNGQPLPVRFEGSVVAYFGWYLLTMVAMISIIGWAWALTAWMRWICRNITGTRRDVQFTASGLDVLWRTVAFVFASVFIIPIPWVLRWYSQWFVAQFALVARA